MRSWFCGRKRIWLAILLCCLFAAPALADRPIVAAASDLQFALPEIARQFEQDTGRSVRLNFGSSGNFRRQIAQGAPFELFLSADEAYVQALAHEGHTEDDGTLYALGRIVLLTGGSQQPVSLQELTRVLDEGRLNRFAIANPEHAPYGVAAREALQAAGVWEAIRPHLVFGENVSQAAQFALSGETDGGIVAYSLALAPRFAQRSHYRLIPENMHSPLRQRMVLLKGAGESARSFYAYLQEPASRAILADYGFEVIEQE